jgi:flagellar hook-length control protein FliK
VANAAVPTGADTSSGRSFDLQSRADQSALVSSAASLPDMARGLGTGAAAPTASTASISVPVNSGAWPQAVAAQVHWLVGNGVQSATLRLSPEHLGPLEVHIDVQSSQVNVNFSAAHAETRAALEQTVPRLREIFATGGLTLGQTNVQADPRPGSQTAPQALRAALAQAQSPAVEPAAAAAMQALGLVDEYA